MMIKSDGSVRYGVWEKGIYQKESEENKKDCLLANEKPLFPIYGLNGDVFDGVGTVEYSNGGSYSGSIKSGLRHGKASV